MLNQIQGLHHVTSMASDARAEQRLLHRHARPAPGQEDRQFRRARRLPPLLRRRARHARLGDDLLPVPATSARRRKGAGEVGADRLRGAEGRARLLARAAGRRRASRASPRTRRFGEKRLSLRRAGRRRAGAGRGRRRPRALDRRRRAGGRGDPRLPSARRCGCATAARPRSCCASWATRRPSRPATSTRCRREGGNGADVIDIETLPGAPRGRPRRRLGAPHRLRGARPGGAARGAQGAGRHRLPGDAGDRPRLFLGDLLPHARAACSSRSRPTSPASTATRTPRISARR